MSSKQGRPATHGVPRHGLASRAAGWRWLAYAALTLLMAACTSYPGAYPVDIFPEMHYQASQRRLAPNRLAAPEDAVPVTGSRPLLNFDQATPLRNPLPRSQQVLERGSEVYRVNCAVCHGAMGNGQSVVAQYYTQIGFVPPVDLAGARVRARTDGQLYWIVINGLGNMPPFGNLLNDDELWAMIYHIHELQGPQ